MGLKYETAQYEASYGAISQLPSPETPEVAFVGRSNVGKSSLLNKLIGRKQLARVSSVPGKTANINFFDVDGVKFVDLPDTDLHEFLAKKNSAGQTSLAATLSKNVALTWLLVLLISDTKLKSLTCR